MREVLNVIFYLNRSGCQWDMLPHDLPAKSTVSDHFAQWKADGTWQKILDALRRQVRVAAGKEPTPSAGGIDSPTVKATEVAADRGSDGGQKIHRAEATYPRGHLGVAAGRHGLGSIGRRRDGGEASARLGGVCEVAPAVGRGADVRLARPLSAE
jgi:transposase